MKYANGDIYMVTLFDSRVLGNNKKDKDLESYPYQMDHISKYFYKFKGYFDKGKQLENGTGKFQYPNGETYDVIFLFRVNIRISKWGTEKESAKTLMGYQ